MLSDRRIIVEGRSDYAHEQEAIQFIRDSLPDRDPIVVWELIELVDPSTGNIHEIDAIILGYSALYLVEIKSGPGVYRGDTLDWTRQPPGGPERFMKPPLKLTNFKAKVLKSLLARRMGERDVPWVQPLVFLSHPDAELKFRNYGDQCVVSRKNFVEAITHHNFPGSDSQRLHQKVGAPQARSLLQGMKELGIRRSEGGLRVGSWKLTETLDSGPGFVDRLAEHVETKSFRRRARSYLVPEQTSTERRQQLRRAAHREAQLLEDVKGHPNILRINDFVADAEPGPTVLFDHFNGEPLDAFLRREKELSFSDRIALIEQIGGALEHCHKKAVYHGGLSPAAILVGRDERGQIDSRLFNFQLGGSAQVTHTVHWSALASDESGPYQAPELREDPMAPRDSADVFSLGAVSYFILTGRAPADSVEAANARLKAERHYDPLTVDDSLKAEVAQVIAVATDWLPINRFDSPAGFLEYLLDAITTPEEPTSEDDPLGAKKGEVLAGEYEVEAVLGQGASSRVLKVKKRGDGRSYALKVALNETEDERLIEEGQVLASLRHQRIVQLYDSPVIGARRCLLLALAGDQTLQRRLKSEGLISLDYAARFGEDLLLALEQLEEQQILHRDIKPANIGVGPVQKKANHLMLFDFSLGLELRASAQPRHARSQISIGTTAYRDPYLVDRGAWDYAADRYSAAITLHEMITGVRPSYEPEGASARDPEARLTLARERFDAAVRDRLTAFFEKALQADAERRHADAAAMRRAWNDCFASATMEQVSPPRVAVEPLAVEAPAVEPPAVAGVPPSVKPPRPPSEHPPSVDGSAEAVEEASTTDPSAGASASTTTADGSSRSAGFDLASVSPDAPLAELPLNSRALNALDRAGVTKVGELASLPDNQLSAVRGVGTRVVRDVVSMTQRWLAARQEASSLSITSFFPGYSGEDTPLLQVELDSRLARTLSDAGLSTLKKVAAAPESQVLCLVERAHAQKQPLLALLKAAQKNEELRAHPTSVDGWLRALLPKQKKRAENIKSVFGLSGPLAGSTDILVSHAAKALHLTAPALYIALGKCKDEWKEQPAFADLADAAHAVVQKEGGALPLERAAQALLEIYPASPQLAELCEGVEQERQALVAASALFRIVGIAEKDLEAGLRWERLEGAPWVLASGDMIEPLIALGNAADALAKRETVASSGETVRFLRAEAEGTPFAALTDSRLIELAAAASENAARSSRLEIYPRGMSAKRALDLSAATLVGKLSPEDVQKRVRARYPAAEELPPRPELDELLSPLRLFWKETDSIYVRPDEVHNTHATRHTLTAISSQNPLNPEAIRADQFNESIQIAKERGRFRVLAVRSDEHTTDKALLLSRRFGLELVDLNEKLWKATQLLMDKHGVQDSIVHQADVAGPSGSDWPQLVRLMTQAAQLVLAELLEKPAHRLLINPGLLARYGLDDFLRQLVHNSRAADSRATFLLVPGRDATPQGVPRINDHLVIPEVGSPDTLIIPHGWLGTMRQAS